MSSLIFDYLLPFNNPSVKGKVIESQEPTASGVPPYCIYLPPDYDENKKYPILYHLHGAGSLYYFVKKEVLWTATELEKAGVSMIVAAPWDSTKFGMWADGDNTDIATQIHDKFIPEIESKYSVKGDRASRFIQGFSMGGFGAATHGLKFQEKFSKIVIWDGALHNWETLTTKRSFIVAKQFSSRGQESFELWSPWAAATNLAKEGKLSDTPIMIHWGKLDDTNSFGNKFFQMLTEQGATVQHVETDFPHSLRPFMETHGSNAIEFLLK